MKKILLLVALMILIMIPTSSQESSILDEVIKTYNGTFTMQDVTVNSNYKTGLAGNIKWDFEEYYDIGGWKEYVGRGKAAYSVERIYCSGGPANFSDVPVEGRMKVYDDKRYEFLINLVSEDEVTRKCKIDDYTWEETYTPGGGGMSSGDPCATSESYEHYTDITNLTFARNGSCEPLYNLFQMGWSFKAVK